MSEAQTAQTAPQLLTTEEAAERLGIKRRQLYNLISAGEIPTVRLPSRTGGQGEHRIEEPVLAAFIDAHRQ